MIGLIDSATIYTPDPTTGAYSVVAMTGLACRLALATTPVAPDPDRAEVNQTRRLLWGPSYLLPETAQVEVAGERWNVRPGTLDAVRGPSGAVAYRRCDVVRTT